MKKFKLSRGFPRKHLTALALFSVFGVSQSDPRCVWSGRGEGGGGGGGGGEGGGRDGGGDSAKKQRKPLIFSRGRH